MLPVFVIVIGSRTICPTMAVEVENATVADSVLAASPTPLSVLITGVPALLVMIS